MNLRFWQYSLIRALAIGGALLSYRGYAFAQSQCSSEQVPLKK